MLRGIAIVVLTSVMVLPAAQAGESSLHEQRFDVSIRDQNLRDVYQEISLAIGVPILLSDAVNGRVSVSFDEASAVDMLDSIAVNRGLDWRFDGKRIRVTARSEQVTRIVDLDGVRLDQLRDALNSLGVYSERFGMTAVDGEFAMIVAPPDYIAVVEVVLGALVEREARERAERDAERDLADRKEQQQLEFERMRRAAAIERERAEMERKRNLLHEQELRARRGPNVIRNGVWGG